MLPRLAIVCAAASFFSATIAAADPRTMVQVPGGVVDESQQLAYLQNLRGGLDAVELSTGRVRWSEAAPQRPLAGENGRLLVELVANDGVRLCVREAKEHGRVWVRSERLPLPSWAVGGPSRGRSFDSTVEWVDGGAIRYQWSATRRWSQGMHPPSGRQGDEGDAEPQTARGAMLVDLKRAKVSLTADGPAPAASMAYETSYGLLRTSWRVDGVWCSLATETIDGVQSWLVRRRSDDGRSWPPLKGGRAGTNPPRLSLDGRLLVMSTTSTGRALSVRLPGGEVGPALNASTLAREFSVSGALLLEGVDVRPGVESERPYRELRALNLGDDSLKWTHPLYVPPPQSLRQ